MQTSFILMNDLSSFQRLFDLLLHRSQLKSATFDQFPNRPFTHLDSQQVPHHFTGTSQWQQLLFDQIHCVAPTLVHIRWGLYPGEKCRYGDLFAVQTLFLLRPIFPHHHTRRPQIHDLAPLSSTRCHRVQLLLSDLTPVYLQLDDLISRRVELQAVSSLSSLPSRFLLSPFSQALPFAHKTIRASPQLTIVSIFRESLSQSFHLLSQAVYLLTSLF